MTRGPQPQPRLKLDSDMQALVMKYERMARHEARKIYATSKDFYEYEILESEAFFGLVDAAASYTDYCDRNNYDIANLDYFQYYATQRVRGTLYDFLRAQTHLSRTEIERAKAIKAMVAEGKSYAEISEILDVPETKLRKVMASVRDFPLSIELEVTEWKQHQSASMPHWNTRGRKNERNFDEGSSMMHKIAAADAEDPEAVSSVNSILELFASKFQHFPENVQLILAYHYYEELSLRQVARLMKLSFEHVTQLHKGAINEILEFVKEQLTS